MKLSTSFFIASLTSLCMLFVACGPVGDAPKQPSVSKAERVLIFSKTTGWRHDSIETGVQKLKQALISNGIKVVASEDASNFNDSELLNYSAIVFLNTTGDVLNAQQQVAMERYIQAGGGFVGIHSATDTESQGDWYWYRRLVGAVFKSHPSIPSNVQLAKINVLRKDHPATSDLPDSFLIADEWYDFKSLSSRRVDLLKVDEGSYSGGGHGEYHPIAWHHEFDGGRAFYTGIGHRAENYDNPLYMQHLLGGVKYAIGKNERNYKKSRPEPNRFAKQVMANKLNEPVSLDITQDGKGIVIVERKGQVVWLDVESGNTNTVGKVEVFSAEGFGEFGLLAVALDPNFVSNQHIYMMYNTPSNIDGNGPLQVVSRYTLTEGEIDLESRIDMLAAANEDTCCHTGGNLEFDAKGNLYIAMGDNTNPFEAFSVGPADFRINRDAHDAYRSSGNTQDFRGKILRITPQPDGSYTIPNGNLFSDLSQGKPEVYVMGARNPYTIAFDDQEQTLYYGDVGPDARAFDEAHGSKGFDEINKVAQAGNFGWPMFIANNQAFRQFDYEAQLPGAWNNPLSPRNLSPRNTGVERLPSAQPAFIWYPYGKSSIFPELGAGSRNALVAGVYRPKQGPNALPEYYDGGLFISDFMRRWIMVIFSDDNGEIYKLEKFIPDAEFTAPIDLKFSQQGELYVLEYGSKWHANNVEAMLSRVVYTGNGNRAPSANIGTNVTRGAAPLDVNISASASSDPDNDPLDYTWEISKLDAGQSAESADYTGAEKRSGIEAAFHLTEKGRYGLKLQVSDNKEKSSNAYEIIEVGNAPPVVSLSIEGNQTFIWPARKPPKYSISIEDLEDGIIVQNSKEFERVDVAFNKAVGPEKAVGHLANDPFGLGRAASKKLLCMGCHQEQAASVGPSFKQIAERYGSTADSVAYLKQTIADGSSGKWGGHQMPAHDFLSDSERNLLANYILLLKPKAPSLALDGRLPVIQDSSSYLLTASYMDKGAQGLSEILTQKTHRFISPTIEAVNLFSGAENLNGVRFSGGNIETVTMSGEKVYIPLGQYDLNQVQGIRVLQKYQAALPENSIFELRLGSLNGPAISKGQFNYSDLKAYDNVSLDLTFEPIDSSSKLFLLVMSDNAGEDRVTANISSVTFF